jgi:hypothetical protein
VATSHYRAFPHHRAYRENAGALTLTDSIGTTTMSPVLVSLLTCREHGDVQALATAIGHGLINTGAIAGDVKA